MDGSARPTPDGGDALHGTGPGTLAAIAHRYQTRAADGSAPAGLPVRRRCRLRHASRGRGRPAGPGRRGSRHRSGPRSSGQRRRRVPCAGRPASRRRRRCGRRGRRSHRHRRMDHVRRRLDRQAVVGADERIDTVGDPQRGERPDRRVTVVARRHRDLPAIGMESAEQGREIGQRAWPGRPGPARARRLASALSASAAVIPVASSTSRVRSRRRDIGRRRQPAVRQDGRRWPRRSRASRTAALRSDAPWRRRRSVGERDGPAAPHRVELDERAVLVEDDEVDPVERDGHTSAPASAVGAAAAARGTEHEGTPRAGTRSSRPRRRRAPSGAAR